MMGYFYFSAAPIIGYDSYQSEYINVKKQILDNMINFIYNNTDASIARIYHAIKYIWEDRYQSDWGLISQFAINCAVMVLCCNIACVIYINKAPHNLQQIKELKNLVEYMNILIIPSLIILMTYPLKTFLLHMFIKYKYQVNNNNIDKYKYQVNDNNTDKNNQVNDNNTDKNNKIFFNSNLSRYVIDCEKLCKSTDVLNEHISYFVLNNLEYSGFKEQFYVKFIDWIIERIVLITIITFIFSWVVVIKKGKSWLEK